MPVGGRDAGAAVEAQIAEVELDVLEAHVSGALELGLLRELQEDGQVKPIGGDRVGRPHPHELKPAQEERHHVGERFGAGDRERGGWNERETRPAAAAHFVHSLRGGPMWMLKMSEAFSELSASPSISDAMSLRSSERKNRMSLSSSS